MASTRNNHQELLFPAVIIVSSALLFFFSLHSYLLFHTLVEIFTIVIVFSIFAIAWSSRRQIDNPFLLIIGISYLFVGIFYLLHLLVIGELGIIKNSSINLSIQFWLAARFLEAFSWIAALLSLAGKVKQAMILNVEKAYAIFFTYVAIASGLLFSIFYADIFPQTYVPGSGLTPFKFYSEYIIIALFILVVVMLFRKSSSFSRPMFNLLSLALITKVLTEITLTDYMDNPDFFNILGHVFRFVSFLLLYKAVVEVGLNEPYKFLFQNLKKSEERFRLLVEFSPDPIVVHRNGKMMYANGLAKKLFGIEEKADILGMDIAGFFQPKYREQIQVRIKKIFSGELRQTPVAEMEVLRADGQVVPVEIKGMQIAYAGEMAMESIIRDISERRKAEEALREVNARFQAIFEQNNDGITVADLEGRYTMVNPAFCRMIGYSQEELLQMRVQDLLLDEVESPLFRQVSVEKKAGWREGKLRRKDGSIFPVTVSGAILQVGNRQFVHGIVQDITERKKAEEALRLSEERYRTMFNTMLEGFCIVEVVFDENNKPIDYRFLEINQAFERQTGLKNAKGKLMRELAPEHEEYWFEIYGRVALTGEPAKFINEARALNRWYDVSALRVGGSESRKVAILFNDITAHKMAEKELAEVQAELHKKTQDQLVESYRYMGLVNRKISLLLELEKHSENRRNKKEIVEYVLSSINALSGAKMSMLYIAVGKDLFNLVSSTGLEEEKMKELQVIKKNDFSFAAGLVSEKKRINGPSEIDDSMSFNGILKNDYGVVLPLLAGNGCKGFMFLGFTDRKSMDVQELEFLDVFAKHVSNALVSVGIIIIK